MTAANIEAAHSAIDPIFLNSPQLVYDNLNRKLGLHLLLKIETINPIRSFKGRGAGYYLHTLKDDTPLVTASAGNFGQGLAYAARKRNRRLTIFAAVNANELKIDRMKELGAEVILQGADFDAAKDAAREYAARSALRFVEDGREPEIAEGAGTIAIELLRANQAFDAIVVPVGNGALINGIGTWVKAHAPKTKVVGVCAARAPAMESSWSANRLITTDRADTIADGIAVRVPIHEALDAMKTTVDDIVLVEDEAILDAMRLLLLETGILTEPAGAAGVAALLAYGPRFAGQSIATVLCGGNVTPDQFRRWFT